VPIRIASGMSFWESDNIYAPFKVFEAAFLLSRLKVGRD
jgi:hypothetical protein